MTSQRLPHRRRPLMMLAMLLRLAYLGVTNAFALLQPLPEPLTDPATITHLNIRRRDRSGVIVYQYEHAARPA